MKRADPGAAFLREIDPVCERFEAAILSDSDPCIEEFLDEVRAEARPTLHAHLLELELDYRRRRAVVPRAEVPLAPATRLDRREGTRFGSFVLLRELGRGGMGVVYEALQPELDRKVALKLMSPTLVSSEDFLRRFRREARAAARLHHSHIVQLYEFGEESAVPYIALQLIVGGPLSQRILEERRESSAAPLTAEHARTIARVGAQIASALAYAHAQGVLHRDLKPANILLDASGTAYLSDFGLARIEEEEKSLQSGMLGTLRYMAPECFRGPGGASADIFALGATLYDWVALLSPSEPRDAIDAARGENTPVSSKRRAGVPRDLATILQRAMDPEPARRFASAAELAADLESFLGDRPIASRRPSVIERWWRWQRRNPLLGSALALLVLCLLALGIGSTIAAAIFRRQGEELEQRALAEHGLRSDLSRSLHDVSRQLFRTETAMAFRAFEDPATHLELPQFIARWEHRDELRAQRAWEWDFLRAASREVSRRIEIPGRGATQLAVQPGGKWIASAGDQLSFFDRESERFAVERTRDHRCAFVTWSGDGRQLAFVAFGAHILDVETGEIVASWDEPNVGCVALHPTQDLLAASLYSRDLVLVAWRTGEVLWRLPSAVREMRRFGFSPDGTQLAFLGKDGRPCLLRLEDRSLRFLPPASSICVWSLAWHPSGRLLAVATDASAALYDPERGTLLREIDREGRAFVDVSFDASGDRLALTCEDCTIHVYDDVLALSSKAGGELRASRVMRGIESGTLGAVIDPSGDRAFAAGIPRTLHVWDLDRAPAHRAFGRKTLQGPTGALGLAWAARTGSIWSSTREGVRCWTPEGTPCHELLAGARAPALSHGERYLAVAVGNSVRVHATDTLALVREIEAPCHQLAWQPHADRLAIVDRTAIRFWNVFDEAAPAREWRPGGDSEVVFDPDGARLWVRSEKALHRLELESFHLESFDLGPAQASPDSISAFALQVGGGQLACGRSTGAIECFDLRTQRFERRLEGHGGCVRDLAWSPDGTRLASVSEDATLRLWDVEAGAEVVAIHGPGALAKVIWSADGAVLAALSERGRVLVWDASSARTGVARR